MDGNLTPLHEAIHIAVEHHRAGRTGQAEGIYRQILSVDPTHLDALHLLGLLLYHAGNNEAGIEFIGKAIAVKPDFAEAHSNLGCVLHAARRYDEAEASYRIALDISPDLVEANSSLGWLLQDRNRFDEAIVCYEAALRVNPNFAHALNNLGAVLQEKHQYNAAVKCYLRAIEIDPSFASAFSNLGSAKLETGDLDEALKYFQHAIALRPSSAVVFKNVGNTFKAMLRNDDAIEAYKRALSSGPESVEGMEAAVKIGVLLYLCGRLSDAAEVMGHAVAIRSNESRFAMSAKTYLNYFYKLIRYRDENAKAFEESATMKRLHVIGDSHCLTLHDSALQLTGGMQKCVSHWVEGCKQWHLGSGTNNQHKVSVAKIMQSLPAKSEVMFVFGEIDCRLHHGIFRAWEKDRTQSIEVLVLKTVMGYIRFISDNNNQQHSIIICGVPASRIVDRSDPDFGKFVGMMGAVNRALQQWAHQEKFGFLDVYGLTDAGDGGADGSWHIDDVHLKQETYQEAFASWWRPGEVFS